jgi:hypothetical protein
MVCRSNLGRTNQNEAASEVLRSATEKVRTLQPSGDPRGAEVHVPVFCRRVTGSNQASATKFSSISKLPGGLTGQTEFPFWASFFPCEMCTIAQHCGLERLILRLEL